MREEFLSALAKSPPKVRFAPSPTGLMHLGNARTALLNHLFAKKYRGHFVLRLDDTDLERSTKAFAQAILEDLEWLGIGYDSFFRQSDHLGDYAVAADTLRDQGRLYPCYESPEELEVKRKLLLSKGRPPIYDRQGLSESAEMRREWEKQGRKPHWRFLLEDEEVSWNDGVRGHVAYHTRHLSDPILLREDGSVAYTLASVVDDIRERITHVLRGEDHVTNTAVQIQLFRALAPWRDEQSRKNAGKDTNGYDVPQFAHFPMILDADGEKFSKRLGAKSLRDLRNEGMLSLAIASVLTTLGLSTSTVPKAMDDLVEVFDLSAYGKSAARLSVEALWAMNRHILGNASWQEMRQEVERFPSPYVVQDPQLLWEIVRENMTSLADFSYWQRVCLDADLPLPLVSLSAPKGFFEKALLLLPEKPWGDTTWKEWTNAIGKHFSLRGRELFLPLRQVLTGKTDGPKMHLLFPLISPQCVSLRLRPYT